MYMVVTVLVLIRGHVSFVFFVSQVDAKIAFHCPWLPHAPHFWPLGCFAELLRLTCCVLTLAEVVRHILHGDVW